MHIARHFPFIKLKPILLILLFTPNMLRMFWVALLKGRRTEICFAFCIFGMYEFMNPLQSSTILEILSTESHAYNYVVKVLYHTLCTNAYLIIYTSLISTTNFKKDLSIHLPIIKCLSSIISTNLIGINNYFIVRNWIFFIAK